MREPHHQDPLPAVPLVRAQGPNRTRHPPRRQVLVPDGVRSHVGARVAYPWPREVEVEVTLLRRLLRLFRRPRPNPAPPASGAPAANPDGGTWLPVGLLLVNFDETFATSNAEPPCPCEACARFDVRVDAVLRARSSKEVPATGDAG